MKAALTINLARLCSIADPVRRTLRLGVFVAMSSSVIAEKAESGLVSAPASLSGKSVYLQRVDTVRKIPELAAFWDFVRREDGENGTGNFLAYTAAGDEHRYVLEPRNISWDYWQEGRPATLADFPLLGRGPFGQAVYFRTTKELSQLSVLEVPRAAFHDTPLDVKGAGKSVSMVAWLIYQEGNHAIAGIWHEGTLTEKGTPALVKEQGRRQFAMFAGMGGNPGAVGAHLSENGLGSFGDEYARHLAVTPEKMKSVTLDASPEELDAGWSVAGFVFDEEKKSVTTYLNGVATERWVQTPARNRFYRAAERAWRQARLARIPGLQPGEDAEFPRDQFYEPPESAPSSEEVLAESANERTVLRSYEYTKVRVTLRRDADGVFTESEQAELVALRANPYWFGHDLYSPKTLEEGGPFTIGRVIHSGRGGSLTAYIGGVAVYGRALSSAEMVQLAQIGIEAVPGSSAPKLVVLKHADLTKDTDKK